MSRVPILIILGSTGTGKSRLSIELAQKFSGEIISADSMQVYKGLDIITAKVTEEERLLAPHHMLNFVDPLHNYCVLDFQKKALPIISDIFTRRKMPIIVGGTNYYIESLLWQVLVEDPDASGNSIQIHDGLVFDKYNFKCEQMTETMQKGKITASTTTEFELNRKIEEKKLVTSKKMEYDDNEQSNEDLHLKLTEVDPEMARRLHPNNRRKIIRSLEVFETHGAKHSEILRHQQVAGGSSLGGPLRFPNSLILWLKCDQEILDKRLDQRVDTMLEAGLVEELLGFHERYNQERININASPDYTKGIFQSIGFKEFHNYLILPETERNSDKGKILFQQGVFDLKLVTRRYARRQLRWILNRFIKRIDRQVPPIYELDCTNIQEWNSKVLEPAIKIINAKLKDEIPAQKSLNRSSQDENLTDSKNQESHWCETCKKILIGELQWNSHKNGAKHRKMEKKKKNYDSSSY
ncbi:tRNA dimethylallyltransferase isoform X1 [Microplitis demolitor]|uniref:tRNA dimethylallyltransferase isoform X1 n=1 Tax=Microplitis demolitor TaxID=69319 RepID=UPI00235B6709|nr:tRNA dimethylallyltransferase isoform X1 [Microplitis demolitor]